jgi:hypothetical protein
MAYVKIQKIIEELKALNDYRINGYLHLIESLDSEIFRHRVCMSPALMISRVGAPLTFLASSQQI